MWNSLRHGAASLAAAIAVAAAATLSAPPAGAGPERGSVLRIATAGHYPITRQVTIGLDKSLVVELPREVANVHVSNPGKLDAVLQTGRRAYLIGVEVGQANAFFFDRAGEQILALEVVIERDLTAIGDILHRLMPDAKIVLEAVNDNVIVSGRVRNAADAARVADIVGRMVPAEGSDSKVINMLAVDAKEQVYLKVTVAEMQRNAIRQLGVDLSNLAGTGAAIFTSGNYTFSALRNLAFPLNDKDVVSTLRGTAGYQSDVLDIRAMVRALEQNNLIRTLAEPTLTAISGETASFLAGGEFPVPISQDTDRISVEFKPFGVGLAFTPFVLSEGRISLKVSTEVSELTNEGAINLSSISIPGLKVRRANTTIELPSGGSLVIAGLISEDSKQAMTGTPGIKNLPVLGALFRSRDFISKETELVVIVTPYVVDPAAPKNLARPDDGFALPTEMQSHLLGHLNRVYGKRPKHMPVGGYKGDFGFIIE